MMGAIGRPIKLNSCESTIDDIVKLGMLELFVQYFGGAQKSAKWHAFPRQYPWVFEIELVKVEDSIPWYVFAVLLSPILIGELYIKITGKTPGEALNEYLYGDILKDL
jgi:hypothetical protein